MAKRGGLGKGLDALFEDNSVFAGGEGEQLLPISELTPNPNQPRKEFDRQALEQLADSIREHGILQPLVVAPLEDGSYRIVAGERRYRAARMAGLTEVPVTVRELSEQEIIELALIENLQREDLNPMEEAAGYCRLMEEYRFTQEQVAHSVGKSRPVIANALRLLNLPQGAAALVREKKLSAGHARAILSLESAADMESMARLAAEKNLTVRQVEALCKKRTAPPKPPARKENYLLEVEAALKQTTGREIKVSGKEQRGTVTLPYYSKEELGQLADLLAGWLEG